MRHTDTNETKRNEGGEGDVLRHIKRSLLGEALGEDDRLGDIKVKSRILDFV
jgi:hypothetical protein